MPDTPTTPPFLLTPAATVIAPGLKALLFPEPVAGGGGGASRPDFGQMWPRGNSRGNG